jgi:5-methylthioadenosine/S-adenosylhomocysteine deaminase
MADDLSLPIHSHVSQSIEEFERSQEEYGCSPIERLSREGTLAAGPAALLVHALFTSESDLGLLSPERHVLGYCPYSQVQFCFPAPILAWRAHDIPIALGTDCAACNDTMSVQRELRVYAGAEAFQVTHGEAMSRYLSGGSLEQARDVWAGRTERFDGSMACVSEADRLASVWGVPGNLHPALPLGEIRVGYRANLLIFDVDHPSFWPRADLLRALSFSDSVPAIWGMLVNGKWMGRRGEFHRSIYSSLAYKEALTEADERIQLLLKRL